MPVLVLSDERKQKGFRSGIMTRLPDLDVKKELDRRARKWMPEPALYCATRLWPWKRRAPESLCSAPTRCIVWPTR